MSCGCLGKPASKVGNPNLKIIIKNAERYAKEVKKHVAIFKENNGYRISTLEEARGADCEILQVIPFNS